jgi:putative sterol carrier protein
VNTVAPLAATRLTEDVMPPDVLERLQPEFVAPLVLYLCSSACTDSGLIVNAGGGFYSRPTVISAPATLIGDGQEVPTVEAIHRHWARIDSLTDGQPYANANVALMDMLTGQPALSGRTSAEEEGAEAAGDEPGLATVEGVFGRMGESFQADAAASVDVVFQFHISGGGGGDWHVTVKEGTCTVESGVHDRPTTTLRMADEDFLALVGGRLPAMQAFTTGKLRIEGDLMKSQLIEKLFKW